MSASSSAAPPLAMENANPAFSTQAMDEIKEVQIQNTIAQVEVNPIQLDSKMGNGKLPLSNNTVLPEKLNGINAHSVVQSAHVVNNISDVSNVTNDAIELSSMNSNGSKLEFIGPKHSSQSPRTLPRSHATQRRPLHTDIHSASASPSLPSRNSHQNYTSVQFHNNSSPVPPRMAYGARSHPADQSPAGIQSISSDSPSVICQDSNENSISVLSAQSRKEAMQQKVTFYKGASSVGWSRFLSKYLTVLDTVP